jgi:hypothetical protein
LGSTLPQRLPGPCAKFESKPSDKILQQSDSLIISWAVVGLRLSVPDSRDQGLRYLHCAGVAKQVKGGSSILRANPRSPIEGWVGVRRRAAAIVVEVSSSTDVADRCVQLLITEPALMFLAPL